MYFDLIVPKLFKNIPEREYINQCCVGGDEILLQFKPEIALRMKIDENLLEIYQEDWGWALEFSKDEVFYFLGIGNAEETGKETSFTVNIEANRKEKGILFSKKKEAVKEIKGFGGLISEIAKNKDFEVKANSD